MADENLSVSPWFLTDVIFISWSRSKKFVDQPRLHSFVRSRLCQLCRIQPNHREVLLGVRGFVFFHGVCLPSSRVAKTSPIFGRSAERASGDEG